MISGRIRIEDIPRLIALLGLFLSALFFSTAEHVSNFVRYPTAMLLSGCLCGPMYFYDYSFIRRYAAAIVLSWCTTGGLLLFSLNKTVDSSVLLAVFGSVFASLLVGVAIFCTIRHVIDTFDDPRHVPSEESDDYSVRKVLSSSGFTLCGFSILVLTIEMGDQGVSEDLDWPESYYYAIIAATGLLSAIMMAYHRGHALVAYAVAIPTGCVGSLFLATWEMKREQDFSPVVFFAWIIGMLPGVAVFFVAMRFIRRYAFAHGSSLDRSEYRSVVAQREAAVAERQEQYATISGIGHDDRDETDLDSAESETSRKEATVVEMV